jgi:hypothetical protein
VEFASLSYHTLSLADFLALQYLRREAEKVTPLPKPDRKK